MGRIIGSIPTVTFLPQDLELFSGPPARRRALLNELLRQVSPEFVQSLTVYERTLKQRNMLLKRIGEGIGQEQDLVVWDEILAREGAFITLSHLELLNVLQCTLVEELSSLGESWGDVRLAYDRSGSALERRKMEEELLGALRHFRPRDLELRATTVGPHRHDWHMDVDGRSLPGFASRGQQRTAVVALLFLQVSYMELRRNEKPVVLLDDVFSELDDDHQSRLFESLAGHQVLLTATRLPSPMEGAVVWEVEGGAVHPQRALRPKVASVH
jgi:DNA replication and repair protein RecF